MNTNPPEDDEADEYDFTVGERGRLAERLENGFDVVVDGKDQAIHVPSPQMGGARAKRQRRRKRGASAVG